MKTEKSKKWLNYCKGVATVLTAVAAMSGAGLSIYLKFNPQEPTAKESYIEMQRLIEKLSDNIIINNRNVEMLFQMDSVRSSRLDSIDSRLNSTLNSIIIATSGGSRSSGGSSAPRARAPVLEKQLDKLVPKKKNEYKHKPVDKVISKPYEQIQQQAQERWAGE
jgi:hypothetical protein